MSPLVERALRVAARCHRGQTRKGTEIPYLVHPCAVVMILQQAGIGDECILAAALLHDVVEDTDCTLAELHTEFPENVVQWVAELSERKTDDRGADRPWIDRKREHLEHIATAPWPARAIALADKIHNLSSILYDQSEGAEVWSRFNASPDQILWYNREMIAVAAGNEPQLVPLKTEGARLIEELAIQVNFR